MRLSPKLLLFLLLNACGGALVPSSQRPSSPLPNFAELRIIQQGLYPAPIFQRYGVNPSVETLERPLLELGLSADTASWSLSLSALERGLLPDPAGIRVEEFIHAQLQSSGSAIIQGSLFKSPDRPDHQILALKISAPQEQRRPYNLLILSRVEEQEALLSSLPLSSSDRLSINGGPLRSGDLLPLQDLRRSPPSLLSLLARAPQLSGPEIDLRLIYIGDGGDLPLPPPSMGESSLLLLGREEPSRPYHDAALLAYAQASGAPYLFNPNPKAPLLAPRVMHKLRAQLRFEPRTVLRYRLLGYESRLSGAKGALSSGGDLLSGQRLLLLLELKLQEGAELDASLGELRLEFEDSSGEPQRLSQRLQHLNTTAQPELEHALLAATFAEKLRGGYWASALSYQDLLLRAQQIQAPPLLSRSIERALHLDQRSDPWAAQRASLGFERLPILAP